MMKHSFAPFDRECEAFLTKATHIDFTNTDWNAPQWLCVSARDDGKLMGVCCFEFANRFDAHLTIAIADPRCVTRRVLAAMFTAVFSQAVRVTAYVSPANPRALRQVKRMGFRPEGYGRKLVEGERDAVIFGMLREDCRYLVSRETSWKVAPGLAFSNVSDGGKGHAILAGQGAE